MSVSLKNGPNLAKMMKVENVQEVPRPKEVVMSKDLKLRQKPDTRNDNSQINFGKSLKIFISKFLAISIMN